MGKICFISIKKDELKFERLLNSVRALEVPEGWDIDFLETTCENGIAAAYNEALGNICAAINIYIDGEAEIVDAGLLIKLADVFSRDEKIAVIGAIGAEYVPANGMASESAKIYGNIMREDAKILCGKECIEDYKEVMAVEGFFMAIRGRLRWRDDLFRGEAFYDTAQCVEYKRIGLKTVVLTEGVPIVKYDRKSISISKTEKNSFLDEYSKDIYPLVTILIPTYQRPGFFKLALESVLAQTYRNLEIFISDNSNDERTKTLMDDYLKRDKRIIYEHHPEFNRHENWERVYTYDNPKAEYINWLMDDDLYAPDKIEKMIDYYFQDDSIALVTSFRQRIDENGNDVPANAANAPIVESTQRFDGKSVGKALLQQCLNFIGEPTTVLLKKKLLKGRLLGWSGREGRFLVEDYTVWLRLLQYGDMIYIREPLSFFRTHSGQDQNSVEYLALNAICWAHMIQYAIHNKVYLTDDKSIRQTYCGWISRVLDSFPTLADNEEKLTPIEKEDYKKLKDILYNVSSYLSGRGTSDFEVDTSSEFS